MPGCHLTWWVPPADLTCSSLGYCVHPGANIGEDCVSDSLQYCAERRCTSPGDSTFELKSQILMIAYKCLSTTNKCQNAPAANGAGCDALAVPCQSGEELQLVCLYWLY